MTVAASSAISSVLCSSGHSAIVFSNSLIMVLTSLIIHCGVDAPAITPIISFFLIYASISSAGFAIVCTFLQYFLHISPSFAVLELFLPPTTTMQSHILANSAASRCLSSVVLQMVLKQT